MSLAPAEVAKDKIVDVKIGQTRDLMRGLLDRQGATNVNSTFSKLMDNVTADDMVTVDKLLRKHNLFSHLTLSEEFPSSTENLLNNVSLNIIPNPQILIDYILYRANESSVEVVSLLDKLDEISRNIFSADDEDVFYSIVEALDTHGYSITLARKLAFVLGHYEKDSDSWKLASQEFSRFGLEKRNYGMMAVADSIGIEFSYLDVISGFTEFADLGPKATNSQILSNLSFNPITLDYHQALASLAASYKFSLIDAVIFLLCHRALGVFQERFRFSKEIEDAWERIDCANHSFSLFFNSADSYCDVQTFRASPAFMEYQIFRNFRAATQGLYKPTGNTMGSTQAPNLYEDRFYQASPSIRDLLPEEIDVYEPLPTYFDTKTSGSLARSCGLARLVEKNPDFAGITMQEMGDLMGSTLEMDRLLSTSALRRAAKSADDAFVVLILRTLVRSHSASTMDAYQFKMVFQDYVTSQCSGDIVAFIELVSDINSDIVEYYIVLLDETMLSQLPFLVKTSERVYETKAEILEWQAKRTGKSIWTEKAKELRIDRKIAAVRGQINETRLNIDGVRFRQWIDSNKLTEFSGLIRQEAVVVPVISDFKARKGISELLLTAHRDPNARACVAIMDSYREFCINADFGIASYLGRRIRHGTLRGTLLDGLPDPTDYSLSQSGREYYEQWLELFRSYIVNLNTKLHFAGRGAANSSVISPEVDNKEKWAILSVCLRSIHEKSQSDQGSLQMPLIVEQYCWYMFELELRDIQKVVTDSRAEVPHFKPKQSPMDPAMIGFERAVNVAISNRLAVVASWFKKPPNISPVAQLSDIIKVVLAEAKGEYPKFRPRLNSNVMELELSGGVYYHLYDALSVVVRNAAKHGAHPGDISISTVIEDRTSSRVLRINVESQVKAADSGAAAIARMDEAGRAGAINADIIEGFSGVRKLHKMRKDKTLSNFELYASDPDDRRAGVAIWLTLSGDIE